MRFDAQAIACATGGTLQEQGPLGPVLTDTRTLVPGAWYLALVGERFDGHAFIDRAAEAGAEGLIIASEAPADWQGGVVRVADTTRALQDLGRAARDRLTGPVVALTGSSGKTTTRALLALALEPLGLVHQTVGNLNNHLGVPMTLLAAPEEAAVSVIEMGTSAPGEIPLLADIVRPDVRLVVNVGPAHLEDLGGLEGVAREKGSLLRDARPGDLVCINLDDPHLRDQPIPPHARIVTFGRAAGADVRLLDAAVEPSTLSTRLRCAVGPIEVSTVIPAPGLHIAADALAALAVAVGMGVDPAAALDGMTRYEPVGMRLRIESLHSGAVALNDCYNANPDSTEASLRTLAALPGRRVAVLGDMLELGTDEALWHQRVATIAGTLGLELVVFVGPRMAPASPHCHGAGEVWSAEDGTTLIERLRAWARSGDTVLFKGSRGARVERMLQPLRDAPSAEPRSQD